MEGWVFFVLQYRLRHYDVTELRRYGRITTLRSNYDITAELRHYVKCRNRNAVYRNITAPAKQLRLTSLNLADQLIL